jgi:hypothetical protein
MNKKKEIFTIGDKTTLGIITCFRLLDNEIMVDFDNKNSILLRSKQLQHVKQPLFTTEDGVDVFEGDDIYWININTFEEVNCNKYNDDLGEISIKSLLSKKYEYKAVGFSTKEKAEEYIIMNKKVLSLNDIFDNCINIPNTRISKAAETAILNSLKKIVKNKLKIK